MTMDNYTEDRDTLLADEDTSFSFASADLAFTDLLDLIPKSKKMAAFGAANEVAIVLTRAKRIVAASTEAPAETRVDL